MRCPKCGGQDDKVIDSRASKEGSVIRRRRECLKCQHRFTTYEEIEHEDDEGKSSESSSFEISRRPLGSIRASFGVTSTLDDAVALVEFVRGYVGELDARKERERENFVEK